MTQFEFRSSSDVFGYFLDGEKMSRDGIEVSEKTKFGHFTY